MYSRQEDSAPRLTRWARPFRRRPCAASTSRSTVSAITTRKSMSFGSCRLLEIDPSELILMTPGFEPRLGRTRRRPPAAPLDGPRWKLHSSSLRVDQTILLGHTVMRAPTGAAVLSGILVMSFPQQMPRRYLRRRQPHPIATERQVYVWCHPLDRMRWCRRPPQRQTRHEENHHR